MEVKGLMGGLYRISEWVMRFSIINLLWLVCSIPFIYFFVSAMFIDVEVQSMSELFIYFIPAVIVAPFTLFPATAAAYGVARKWVMGDEDVPLLKTFFTNYKENYKKSMLGGLFFLFMFAILVVNYRFYATQENKLQFVSFIFIAFFIIWVVTVCHFFSILVHFHMKFWQIFKNALLLAIGRPLTSVAVLLSNALILYIAFTKFNFFLVIFFMASIIAYVNFWQFYRVFRNIQVEYDQRKESEQEEAEESAEAAKAEVDASNDTDRTDDGNKEDKLPKT